MKRELRFFARTMWQYIATVAGATAVLIVGMLIFRGSNNLFTMYGAIYPLFAILFPFLFAMGVKGYVSVAISFGARRMPCFAAVELTYAGFSAALVVLSILVDTIYTRIAAPENMMSVANIGPMTSVLEFSLSFLLVQVGLAGANIENMGLRVVVLLFGALLPMGAAFGIAMGASEEASLYAALQQAALPAALVMLAIAAALAFLIANMYKKVVYSV